MKKINQRQQAINRLEEELARESQRKRKDDTRRKILIGALIMGKMRNSQAFEKEILAELDRFLDKHIDRKLFDL